jgi:hypothetical protein
MAGQTETIHDHIISRSDGKPPSYLVRSQNWSLILWGNGTWRALYSLKTDPGQRRNALADHPGVAKTMLAQFARFAATQRRPPLEFLDPKVKPPPLPTTGNAPLTPKDQQRLRALGYLR